MQYSKYSKYSDITETNRACTTVVSQEYIQYMMAVCTPSFPEKKIKFFITTVSVSLVKVTIKIEQ